MRLIDAALAGRIAAFKQNRRTLCLPVATTQSCSLTSSALQAEQLLEVAVALGALGVAGRHALACQGVDVAVFQLHLNLFVVVVLQVTPDSAAHQLVVGPRSRGHAGPARRAGFGVGVGVWRDVREYTHAARRMHRAPARHTTQHEGAEHGRTARVSGVTTPSQAGRPVTNSSCQRHEWGHADFPKFAA